MKILGIDTSCDDTSISVVKRVKNRQKIEILSNVVSSQVKLHQKYGGVYPSLAKREHKRNLTPVLEQALREAGLLRSNLKSQISNLHLKSKNLKKILEREPELQGKLLKFLQDYKKPRIDAIAVTVGPGLEPCLWMGVNFARALAFWWNLPIVPVSHIEAHIMANFAGQCQMSNVKCQIFPAVCLIVSGGHTQLVLMRRVGEYKVIGETRDDAAGECLDKTARVLGLSYPGGPAVAAEAAKFKVQSSKCKIKLPRPMINLKDYDFSFSGLKTAVLYDYQKQNPKKRKSKTYIREMAKEIQQAIIDVLIKKTVKAAKAYKAKSIILGGGVIANKELRRQFKKRVKKESAGWQLFVPDVILATDNAAMIGITALFHPENKKKWQGIKAQANLRI